MEERILGHQCAVRPLRGPAMLYRHLPSTYRFYGRRQSLADGLKKWILEYRFQFGFYVKLHGFRFMLPGTVRTKSQQKRSSRRHCINVSEWRFAEPRVHPDHHCRRPKLRLKIDANGHRSE